MPRDRYEPNTMHVAVIIPVRNGMQDLPSCLAALDRQQDVTYDVFAVDNGSTDGSADYIEQEWPSVHLIRNEANAGVARACNTALKAAGDYSAYTFLHQDTEVVPDWLAHLVAPLRYNPSIGIAGSKSYFPNGTIEHAGGRVDRRGSCRHVGRREPDRGQFSKPRKVRFVSDTALAISRQAYQAVGPLDDGFSPAFYEDVDWCYRVRQAGYHVVFAPKSRLIHKTHSTLAHQGNASALILHANRLRFVLKHWSLDRVVDDFMPSEQRWLAGLGSHTEQAMAVMRRAYLQQLIHFGEIVAAREATFPQADEEVNGLAAVLLGLRAIYPPAAAAPHGTLARASASFRRQFPRAAKTLSSSPITRPLVQFANRQQLAAVLVEYMREDNREIARLAQEQLRSTSDASA